MVLRCTAPDRRMRRSRQHFLVLLGCLTLSAYFIHHAITGKHGFEARSRLIERSRVLEREIAGLETVQAVLQRDVGLLRPDPPHPDMVEEIATGVLGMARPGDRIVVRRDPGQP
jgi:cell division protein FtsB